jgi:hypothetical protein
LLALILFSTIPLCPMAGLFGLPCPGCGMSRATRLVLAGRWSDAWALHPLVFVILPLLAAFVLHRLWGAARGVHVELGVARDPTTESAGQRLGRRLVNAFLLGVLLALLTLWVARFAGYFGGPVPVQAWWAITR